MMSKNLRDPLSKLASKHLSSKQFFFLFICKRLKKLEYLTRWRFVTKIIKKSKKEEEEDKICNSHIFVFGGEKKNAFFLDASKSEKWELDITQRWGKNAEVLSASEVGKNAAK